MAADAGVDADVLIIGSGAGGGTLARALAPSGLSVLILERGDYLPRKPANWDAETVFNTNRYHTDEQWLDGAGKSFHAGDRLSRRRQYQILRRCNLAAQARGFWAAQPHRRYNTRMAHRLR